MAEQNCSSSTPSTPVIITSGTDHAKSDGDESNLLSSSSDSNDPVDKHKECNDEKASRNGESQESKPKLLFSDSLINSSNEKRNGVKEVDDKNPLANSSPSFLRPSILSSGFSLFSSNNTDSCKTSSSPFSLQCPKLSLTTSKFGNGSLSSLFSSSVSSDNAESPSIDSQNKVDKNVSHATEDKSSKSNLGISFTSTINATSNCQVNVTSKSSVISVPNFVFGQNLHERVTDSVKAGNVLNQKSPTETKGNGASEMLFTSVLTSQDVKENTNSESFGTAKESSSLIEDAARCQEARANKRKYEQVQVTTGEEEEENILQINCKLFAFDNGAWVERGRGILRLNDKKCDESTSSRIVIRTLGNLRVVLNTKIWSKMSLNKASERSVRLTAMDPSGQVKIFLIRASGKDMTSLYSLIEERIKNCKDHQDADSEGSPEKKFALDKNEV